MVTLLLITRVARRRMFSQCRNLFPENIDFVQDAIPSILSLRRKWKCRLLLDQRFPENTEYSLL